jgi:DNA-binding PadR family transcriptional regulator
MSRRNQTDLAILGALSLRPMTGYALREAIVEVLGHFWRESFGQIYPALADLEAQGHVRRREGDRPNSSLFELTPEGSARLLALLREPATQQLPRNGLLLRLFFGSMLGHDECKRLVLEARAEAETRLAGFDAIATRLGSDPEPERTFMQITLSAGRHSALAAIAWADDALDLLEGLKR